MVRPLKIIESLIRLLLVRGTKDVWVRDFYSTLTMPFDRTQGKQVVMIHHIDFSGFPWWARMVAAAAERLFYHNLKKVDAIITVSEYWKNHFVSRGYTNVHKIPNGFDLSQFDISEEETGEFKRRYDLQGKPIIYLGNCQRAKGVVESWEALRELDAHLVTSGKQMVKIGARNLELSYGDYLKLLKASAVVLAMSKFQEGWGRTVHEAMLLSTPVIGSGAGGMKELLEGGGQMICENFKDVREKVEYVVAHPEVREEMGGKGHQFAKEFSLQKFQQAWSSRMNNL